MIQINKHECSAVYGGVVRYECKCISSEEFMGVIPPPGIILPRVDLGNIGLEQCIIGCYSRYMTYVSTAIYD